MTRITDLTSVSDVTKLRLIFVDVIGVGDIRCCYRYMNCALLLSSGMVPDLRILYLTVPVTDRPYNIIFHQSLIRHTSQNLDRPIFIFPLHFPTLASFHTQSQLSHGRLHIDFINPNFFHTPRPPIRATICPKHDHFYVPYLPHPVSLILYQSQNPNAEQ